MPKWTWKANNHGITQTINYAGNFNSWLKMKPIKITFWFKIHRSICNVYYA